MSLLRSALALCLLVVLGTAAQATEDRIATWTDAQGVTHFGDPGAAPAGAAEVVVAPTNAMDVPAPTAPTKTRGPVWTVIDQPAKNNRVGWRAKGQHLTSGPISRPQR